MKSFLLFILFFQATSICFSQSLMEVAILDKSKIIYKKPFKFKLKNSKWDLKYKLESLREQKRESKNSEILTDSLILIELYQNAKSQNLENWSNEEIDNVFLIDKIEYLSVKKIKEVLNIVEKSDIKKLRKQVREYNYDKRKWRSFPLSMSRPVYTNDKKYALIAFNYGNNGGKIIVYHEDKKVWINVGVLEGWAY